jgi:hypothetical protein
VSSPRRDRGWLAYGVLLVAISGIAKVGGLHSLAARLTFEMHITL